MRFLTLPAVACASMMALPVAASSAIIRSEGQTYSDKDARTGARLRQLASLAARILYSPCKRQDFAGEQLSRFQGLRGRPGTHANRIDLAAGEARYRLDMSRERVACNNVPDSKEYEQITRKLADDYLDQIEQFLAERPDFGAETLTGAYTEMDVERGVPVQEIVTQLVGQLNSYCSPPNDALLELSARYERLKKDAPDHARRIDFAIGEADEQYEMSLVDINCPEPGSPEESAELEMRVNLANAAFARLETAIAKANPSEE